MNKATFQRAEDILAKLGGIAAAREQWERPEVQRMLAQLLNRAGRDDEELLVKPAGVLQLPVVWQFKRAVFEQLDAEERALRQEFDSI